MYRLLNTSDHTIVYAIYCTLFFINIKLSHKSKIQSTGPFLTKYQSLHKRRVFCGECFTFFFSRLKQLWLLDIIICRWYLWMTSYILFLRRPKTIASFYYNLGKEFQNLVNFCKFWIIDFSEVYFNFCILLLFDVVYFLAVVICIKVLEQRTFCNMRW